MWKKSSSISTKDTVVNLYTRNSHFCMAVLKLRRKMYFAFWYFDALVCFIMFCFLYGHQLYFRQKIDHVQTRDNQGIAPAHTYSPFLYHSVFRFLFNFRSLRRVSPCVISCVSAFEGRCRLLRKNSGCYQNIEEGKEKNLVLLVKLKMNVNWKLRKRRAEGVLILRDRLPRLPRKTTRGALKGRMGRGATSAKCNSSPVFRLQWTWRKILW